MTTGTSGDPRPSPRAARGRRIVLIVCLLAGTACSTAEWREDADREVYGIIADKQRQAVGESRPFTVDPPEGSLRSQMLGDRSAPVSPESRRARPTPVSLDLGSVLLIAAENSRTFQSEKETVYRAALDLTLDRHDFDLQWFGTTSAEVASEGGDQSVSQSSSLGFTRLLETGGSLALSIGNDFTRVLSSPVSSLLTTLFRLTITLPVLRGAGRDVAEENLRQSERNALYAVRDFEHFQQVFAVDTIGDYLDALERGMVLRNERQNFENIVRIRERNENYFDAGRITKIEVGQARQQELTAKNRWIRAEQDFRNRLDRLLESLGLPPDATVELSQADLDGIVARGIETLTLEEGRALTIAFRNRLDFANTVARVADAERKTIVAADALGAGLDFTLEAGDTSQPERPLDFHVEEGDFSLGFDLSLPLDRVAERNAYRASLIALEAARRAEAAAEDRIKASVREALRALDQARQSHEIQKNAVALAESRVEGAQLSLEAGRAETRDLLEAQEALLEARNAEVAALMDHAVARLTLFRELGILWVSPEGIVHDATQRLLEEP